MEFFGAILDGGFGIVGGVAAKALPADARRRVITRLNDHNPFHEISANHDLTRAIRVAWITAALDMLEAVQKRSKTPDWQSERDGIRLFVKEAKTTLQNIRGETLKADTQLKPSAIDDHIQIVMEGVPRYMSPEGETPDAIKITTDFEQTLAALIGYNEKNIPDIIRQVTEAGLPTDQPGVTRSFGELVFASFADIIKKPGAYEEAYRAFHLVLLETGNRLSETTFDAVNRLEATVENIEATLESMEDANERRHRETLEAISRDKGIDPERLKPILERIDATDTPVHDIPRVLEEAVDKLLAMAAETTVISNDARDIDLAIQSARDKLKKFDTIGATATLRQAIADDEAEEATRRIARARAWFEIAEIEKITFNHATAIEALEAGLALDPSDPRRWIDLGKIYRTFGDTDNAARAFQSAVDIAANIQNQQAQSAALDRLGDVQIVLGQITLAQKSFEAALKINQSRVTADPHNDHLKRDLSVSFNKIGDTEVKRGNLNAALQNYNQAHRIAQNITKLDPDNIQSQRQLFVSLIKIGDTEARSGDLNEALKNFNQALKIAQKLAKSDPNNAEWQRDLSVSFNKIGDTETKRGNLNAALQNYTEDLKIAQKLAKADPNNTEWQRDLSVSFNKIGDTETKRGNLNAALQNYTEDLKIAQKLAKADPNNTEWQRDLMASHWRLAQNSDQPIPHWKAVIDILEQMNQNGTVLPVDAHWLSLAKENLQKAKAKAKVTNDKLK